MAGPVDRSLLAAWRLQALLREIWLDAVDLGLDQGPYHHPLTGKNFGLLAF
jgi:hypothetical protein